MDRLRLLAVALALVAAALPSRAERPFKTDDPWQEQLYGWEVFGGVEVGSGSWDHVANRNQVDVTAGFDYGVTERSEYGVSWNIYRMQDPGSDGFGDAAIHYKHRLAEASAVSPDQALDIRLKLPAASHSRRLGSGKADLGLAWLLGWKGERWTTTFRLGYTYTGSEVEEDRVEIGVATRYRASEYVSLLGELYADSNEKGGEPSRTEVSAGMAFTVAPQTTVDLMVTAGLTESVPDAGVRFGVTSRL